MNDHIVVEAHDQVLHCLACGAKTGLGLPLLITEVVSLADEFVAQHRNCRPKPAARRQGVAA